MIHYKYSHEKNVRKKCSSVVQKLKLDYGFLGSFLKLSGSQISGG